MDATMKRFNDLIDGATLVEIRNECGTGVTRVTVKAVQWDWTDEGLGENPRVVTQRLGFATRAAADAVLAEMRRMLDEEDFQLSFAMHSLDKKKFKWANELYMPRG